MESLLDNLNLSVEEDDELVIGVEDNSDEGGDITLCLVGRFLTKQNVNFNIIQSRLAVIWKPKRGVMIKQIGGGRMLIQFNHRLDYKRVVDGGPWTIGNHPLILHQLGAAWRTFMRVRVELDVKQPLKRFKKIRMGNGSSMVVTFKYERLHLFCFICGRLGHSESFCDDLFNSKSGEVKKEWGPFLRAPDKRGPIGGGGGWLRNASDEMGGGGQNASMGEAVGGDTAEKEDEVVGGERQGERARSKAETMGTLQKFNAGKGIAPAYSGAIIANLIFEFQVGQGDETIEDAIIGEAKKRKRILTMHGSEEKGGHAEVNNSENRELAKDGTNLF
ncbi:hypothetical protein ACS0TY_027940 [Phlomoides rotata]